MLLSIAVILCSKECARVKKCLRICRQSKRKQVILVKEYCLVTDPELLGAISQMQALGDEKAGAPVQELPQAKEELQDEEPLQERVLDQSKAAPGPAMQAAIKLRDRVRQNNPRATVPGDDLQDPLLLKWVSELDLLNRKGPPGAKVAEKRGYSWQERAG